MRNIPKTIKEARKHKYNRWAGNPDGDKYQENYCAYEIYSDMFFHQCSRKKGHGPNNLFCKQHAKKI